MKDLLLWYRADIALRRAPFALPIGQRERAERTLRWAAEAVGRAHRRTGRE